MIVEIVPFTLEHYRDAVALWQQSEGVRLHDECDSREAIGAYLERNPGLSFIARDRERVVGAALCGHDGRRGYLHHLTVSRAARGQGVGRRLVARCLEGLRARGIARSHIFIVNSNTAGIAFWERIGWRRRDDISIMSKDL
jgi:ribosomal protein S18 acetylase RimI-like enzyme